MQDKQNPEELDSVILFKKVACYWPHFPQWDAEAQRVNAGGNELGQLEPFNFVLSDITTL